MTGRESPAGFRDSDSLLHSLSSGLWAPTIFLGLECPFLFLLSFLSGHSETPPHTWRRFFYKLAFAEFSEIFYKKSWEFRDFLIIGGNDKYSPLVRGAYNRIFVNHKASFCIHNNSTQFCIRNRIYGVGTNRRNINS